MPDKKKYQENKLKYQKYAQEYYQLNKERLHERSKINYEKRKKDPEFKKKQSEYYKKYYQKNRVKMMKLSNISQLKRQQKWKIEIIQHYTKDKNCCSCCGESIIILLTVDHTNNDGNKHRKSLKMSLYEWIIKNNFPEGFDILCYNCNIGKYRNNGICPHNSKKDK